MGWRADQAYDEARLENYRVWRRSPTWREWMEWEVRRHWAAALGAITAGAIGWLFLR